MPIQPTNPAQLPTRFGDFTIQVFTDANGIDHMALISGKLVDGKLPNDSLVRIHSECATGDIFGSLRCDCRDQLELSLARITEAGSGLFIYVRGHEGRGIGLAGKIRAYALQDQGLDTVDANIKLGFAADARTYEVAIAIICHYGLNCVKLLTNNQRKIDALGQANIKVSTQIPLWTATNPHNETYIATKQIRLGHIK
jgi:GTP cyclohydrolase II